MLNRLLKLPQKQHMILFGARGTGKSTLLKHQFDARHCLWIDLLDPEAEDRFARSPGELQAIVKALPESTTHIIIDEIQKLPKLLDVVHLLIESTSKYFVLTGSSARKLKHGGANLLAGRAFVYHLFPFSFLELGEKFELSESLHWGMLPRIIHLNTPEEKMRFLQAYAQTYLKEEIWHEQLIRNLDPFRRFLEVSAQCNGKIINYHNIAEDVGVDDKTVKNYFNLLEDTLIGFFLEPFQHSFRKRLSQKPKFYYFDPGVVRSLTRTLSLPLKPGTSAYGDIFEQFVIVECLKAANYYQPEFRFSYLKTKDDAEIDLVVERPGQPVLFIEIKSNTQIKQHELQSFIRLSQDFPNAEAVCFSNDPYPKQIAHITVLPWQAGIKQYFA